MLVVSSSAHISLMNQGLLTIASAARERTVFPYGMVFIDYARSLPKITVVDTYGFHRPFLAGIFVAMPYARLKLLGVATDNNLSSVVEVFKKLRDEVLSAWRKHVKNVTGLSISLHVLLSIDVFEVDTLRTYDLRFSIPIKLKHIEEGLNPRITIVVDLSKIKPRIIKLPEALRKIRIPG